MVGSQSFLKKALRIWFPIAVASTFGCGLLYLTLQQSYRMNANDPQIQLSEDIAIDIENGTQSNFLSNSNSIIDVSSSLSPFVTVFDDSGNAMTSTGQLNNHAPTLPTGVFDYVRKNQQTRITWQPQSGVRDAIVVTRFDKNGQKGFVMAGRSLREVENRIGSLGLMVFGGWVAILVTTLLTSFIFVVL